MTNDEHRASELLDRRRASDARALLFQLSAPSEAAESGWTPAWSSAVLEQTIARILSVSNGDIRPLLRGFWDLLQETDAPLSSVVKNLIHDLVVLCFVAHRREYEAEDFSWMEKLLGATCTESQAWFALLALPEPWRSRSRAFILRALQGSPYLSEAQRTYED